MTFVPHLVPLDRGILETIYAKVRPGTSEQDVRHSMESAYQHAPFVRLRGRHSGDQARRPHDDLRSAGASTRQRTSGPGGRPRQSRQGAADEAIQNLNVVRLASTNAPDCFGELSVGEAE